MKKTIRCLTTFALGAVLALPSLVGAMDHSSMGGMDMGGKAKSAGAGKPMMKGQEIRTADVQGFHLTYRLIDMMDEMKDMPMKDMDMSKMKSHHLMVYVAGPDGKTVSEGKVGYLVSGPDKSEQKTMAMFMQGGFGSDVDFKAKGVYKVTTKAVVGDKTLADDFTYTVK
jgi:hypothetical protein